MDSFYANFVLPVRSVGVYVCVRAQLLFWQVRVPVTHTGKLGNIRNLPCFMFRHRASVTFEIPCVYYTVFALRVYVFGDYRQF